MYDEEGNIEQAVTSAVAVLAGVTDCYEVIVVDDGGRDRTAAIADRLAAENPRVRVVHHPVNRGYGAALRSGFAAAQYPLVVLADGDNQFDLGELSVLLRGLGKFDIVSGYRIARHDPVVRRLYAFMYNRLARFLFNIPVRDVNCGFKVYRRDLVERLLPQLRSTWRVDQRRDAGARAEAWRDGDGGRGPSLSSRDRPADRRKPSRDCSRLSRTAGAVA